MHRIILMLPILILSGCEPMELKDVEAYKAWCIRQGGKPNFKLSKDNRVINVLCTKDGADFAINRKDIF